MKKYLIAIAIAIFLVGCGDSVQEEFVDDMPAYRYYYKDSGDIFDFSDFDAVANQLTAMSDTGVTEIKLVNDNDSVDWGANESLTLDFSPIKDFTFSVSGREVVIDLEDFQSMTAQELRDFSTLVNFLRGSWPVDPKLIEIWAVKLLPRFFKETGNKE